MVTAARDFAARERYDSVSKQKIADRIEYTAAAIYSDFPSKGPFCLRSPTMACGDWHKRRH
jgi:hypothetical protein